MKLLRSLRRWIAGLVGLALATHLVAMSLMRVAEGSGQAPPQNAVYVDAILGPTALCKLAASHSGSGGGGTAGTECCLLCECPADLRSAGPVGDWTMVATPEREQRAMLAFLVPSLAVHLRLGGIRGRAPPALG